MAIVQEDSDEIQALQQEFEWLLTEEVNDILNQLQNILVECTRRFPVKIDGIENLVKSEKYSFSYSGGQDQIKIATTLLGDNISQAEVNVKLHRHSNPNLRFMIQNDSQWKLNQIQDASNHLRAALDILSSPPLRYKSSENKFDFHSAEEVIQLISSIMSSLQKGRNALFVPKRRTIEELQSSRNMKSFQPLVPSDLAISFYIQSHKLVCAVYFIQKDSSGQVKFDIYQAETSIPWLSEALVLFTVCLQFCQQLKDKLAVFTQYQEMHRNLLKPPHDEPTELELTG